MRSNDHKHAQSPAWYTPNQVAELLGIDSGKVLYWINTKQVVAVNVAEKATGKPRWRVSRAELDAFLARRQSSVPPVKAKRRLQPPDVIKFY